MPGEIVINTTERVRAKYVQCVFTDADEQAIISGQGQWPEGYVPTSKLSIVYGTDDGRIDSGRIAVTGEVAKAAIREFFVSLPEGHALVRKCLDGTYSDATEGVEGSDNARSVLDGVTMDFNDGSGTFVVEAPNE